MWRWMAKRAISVKEVKFLRSLVYFGWLIVAAAIALPALAQSPDNSLTRYAVNINRTPQQPWPGYGIYLGRGLVITAAHVVGHASQTNPKVLIAGQELPATVIKEGNFKTIDLTLLSVDEERLPIGLRMRRNTLCKADPQVGAPVIVVVPEGIARSRIISPRVLSRDMRAKFPTVIGDVARTGNSGSGVFDAHNKCLLGIMSRRIWRTQIKINNGEPVEESNRCREVFCPRIRNCRLHTAGVSVLAPGAARLHASDFCGRPISW